MLKLLAIALTLVAALIALTLWPVGEPLTAEFVAGFDPPIEQRADTDFYMRVFQMRDGDWHQCKTRISRALFF